MNPIPPAEREPILDTLRGFAILGILLVNMEVMRGPDWLILLDGGSVPASSGLIDRIAGFAIGWLATGKFVSILAILFGMGAALIAGRSSRAGQSPRPLLARRYVWLCAFGIVHMLFLYPGDVLFVYGVTGLILLAFVMLPMRALLGWAAIILGGYGALGLRYVSTVPQTPAHAEPDADSFSTLVDHHHAEAIAAYTTGSYGDIVSVQAWHALLLQSGQLLALASILALFLAGYAIARAGIVTHLRQHRALLTRGAWIGLGVGLPANLALGFLGPLAGFSAPADTEPLWFTRWAIVVQVFGEPVLAVGYLCALSLFCLRRGAIGPLAAVGRMALTAYLLQSALALAAIVKLQLYGQLTTASALVVVAGIWCVLLVVCPLWLRWFALGPLEWLWRSLSYGRVQPMLATAGPRT